MVFLCCKSLAFVFHAFLLDLSSPLTKLAFPRPLFPCQMQYPSLQLVDANSRTGLLLNVLLISYLQAWLCLLAGAMLELAVWCWSAAHAYVACQTLPHRLCRSLCNTAACCLHLQIQNLLGVPTEERVDVVCKHVALLLCRRCKATHVSGHRQAA